MNKDIQDKQDKESRVGLLHEDLTGRIIEACYEVANELGFGFLESVYEKALKIALEEKGLRVKQRAPIQVVFRGKPVGVFYADLLVEDKVILELKTVAALAAEHKAQLINYLKASGFEVGLLINFGKPKIEIKRLFG